MRGVLADVGAPGYAADSTRSALRIASRVKPELWSLERPIAAVDQDGLLNRSGVLEHILGTTFDLAGLSQPQSMT